MPFYAGVTDFPESFKIGDHWKVDRKSARWAFDTADFHTQVVYSLAIEDVKKAQEKWEKGAIKKAPTIEKFAVELYKKDPKQAIEFLTDYCINNANRVVDAWWELGDLIMVKYNHIWLYDIKLRKKEILHLPEWYKRILVEHDKLVPQPEEKQ
jgi:dipeptidase